MANGLVSILNAPKPHKLIATTEDGKQVPFPIFHEIYEAYVCFLKRCEEYFLCQYIPPPDIDSVGEHINYEIELYLSNQSDAEDKHLKKLIFECLLKRETCTTGCNNMNEIDLLELGSYTELQGGNISLPQGYSSILMPMTKSIRPEQIVYSSPVKSIHWKRKANFDEKEATTTTVSGLETVDEIDSDDSDKTVTDIPIKNQSNDDKVRIVCDDGTEYYAKHVICSVPLGVLKDNHKTLFEPELPLYKLESIDRLLFGTVDKIFLEYDRPFLNKDISEVMLLWDTIAHDDQNASIEKTWFRKIYSFSKVSETLMLGWISGKEAEYMETLSHNIVADVCTDILRKFLKDPFIPKPKSCVCTSWNRQQYCRGSYTAIGIGGSQEDIENIAKPLYSSPNQSKPCVLFAGEHTHSNFYSTVHGAYLSGRTAAQIILTPNLPQEMVMESDTSDLSSWIQGIALE